MTCLFLLMACRLGPVPAEIDLIAETRALATEVPAVRASGTVEIEGKGSASRLGFQYRVAWHTGRWLDVDLRRSGHAFLRARGAINGETIVLVRPPGGRARTYAGRTLELLDAWPLGLTDTQRRLAEAWLRLGDPSAVPTPDGVTVRVASAGTRPSRVEIVGPAGTLALDLAGWRKLTGIDREVPARVNLEGQSACGTFRIEILVDELGLDPERLEALDATASLPLAELATIPEAERVMRACRAPGPGSAKRPPGADSPPGLPGTRE